jgi:tetratricopeptide (TPR) repeat protein
VTGPAPDVRRQQLSRLQELARLSRWPETIAAAGELLIAEPDNWEAYCYLALAQLKLDAGQEAAAAAEQAVQLAPDEEWPHRLRALSLHHNGRSLEAVNEAREALRLAPHVLEPRTLLATLLTETNQRPEALEMAAEAVRLAPDLAHPWVVFGNACSKTNDRKGAQQAFERALAIDPQNSAAINGIARLRLRDSGRFGTRGLAAAATGFSSAVRADPTQHVSVRNLEIVLRAFLSRSAYWLFVAVWIARAVQHSPGSSRIAAGVLIAVPLAVTGWFLRSIDAAPRRHLWTLLRRDPALSAAIGLELIAVGVAVAVIISGRGNWLTGAAIAALLARVLVYVSRRRA